MFRMFAIRRFPGEVPRSRGGDRSCRGAEKVALRKMQAALDLDVAPSDRDHHPDRGLVECRRSRARSPLPGANTPNAWTRPMCMCPGALVVQQAWPPRGRDAIAPSCFLPASTRLGESFSVAHARSMRPRRACEARGRR